MHLMKRNSPATWTNDDVVRSSGRPRAAGTKWMALRTQMRSHICARLHKCAPHMQIYCTYYAYIMSEMDEDRADRPVRSAMIRMRLERHRDESLSMAMANWMCMCVCERDVGPSTEYLHNIHDRSSLFSAMMMCISYNSLWIVAHE